MNFALPQPSAFAQGHEGHGEHADHAGDGHTQINDEPGPFHMAMAAMAGERTATTKMWMAPGAQPMESTGSATITSLMGGRFVQENFEGSMMSEAYSGTKLYGYNNATQVFEAVWTYSLATSMLFMKGEKTEDNAVKFSGSFLNPAGHEETMVCILRHIDENTVVLDIMGNEDGVMMSTSYTRD